MEMGVKIEGLEAIEKVFNNLPRATRNKASRPALREGGAVIRKMAEDNVKSIADQGYATGTLEKNIRVYSLKILRGALRVAVQVRRGAVNAKKLVNGEPVRIGLYASVLEYGKENQAPKSWIRKAAREGVGKATQAVVDGISKRLNAVVDEAKK